LRNKSVLFTLISTYVPPFLARDVYVPNGTVVADHIKYPSLDAFEHRPTILCRYIGNQPNYRRKTMETLYEVLWALISILG